MYHFAHRSHLNEDRAYHFRFKTFEDGKPRNYGNLLTNRGPSASRPTDDVNNASDNVHARQIVASQDNDRDNLEENTEKNERRPLYDTRRRPRVSVLVEHW